jgi:RNA polymerase sigma-70 factor (ECF subfamily)
MKGESDMDNKLISGDMSDKSIEDFEVLYNKYKRDVFAVALSIVRDSDLAKDVQQDVFVKLYLQLKNKEILNLKSWLIRVTRNAALDLYRKREHEIYHYEDSFFDNIQFINDVDPVDRIVLINCLKVLDDNERQIVILKAVSGLKHREISKILEQPLGTVIWRYRTALAKLKKNIETPF